MTTTPDYNNGNVHWWNSHLTPEGLHPITVIKYWDRRIGYRKVSVEETPWEFVVCFQVVKQHIEPRVWWVNVYPKIGFGEAYKDKGSAARAKAHDSDAKTIRVVEQPESDT
jgi:hypothetical protein